jgi:hypothetical protein
MSASGSLNVFSILTIASFINSIKVGHWSGSNTFPGISHLIRHADRSSSRSHVSGLSNAVSIDSFFCVKLIEYEFVFFLVTPTDIKLDSTIRFTGDKIKSHSSNARTCLNPTFGSGRNVLKKAGFGRYGSDDFSPKLPQDFVTTFLLRHLLNFVHSFISKADHELFGILHGNNLLNIQKVLVAH